MGVVSLLVRVVCVLWRFALRLATRTHAPAKETAKPKRVAVIGGGIAGCGCAWALAESGVETVVFEAADVLGGNAKTQRWRVAAKEGGGEAGECVTGLSVLAWPQPHFRHYARLLERFAIKSVEVELPFIVTDEDHNTLFNHGKPSAFAFAHHQDVRRWQRMTRVVRRVNGVFCAEGSMYAMSFVNPLNLVPLRVLSRCFGVSSAFWDLVIVPVYSSTFLTVHLNTVPSIIAPLLEELIPIDGVPRMHSWTGNSSEVFAKLTRNATVRLSSPVDAVFPSRSGKAGVHVVCKGERLAFDRVVFACSAPVALALLNNPTGAHKALLSLVQYTDATDQTFVQGHVHSDPSVLPPSTNTRKDILARNSNCVRVFRAPGGGYDYQNTFVLSSWVPCVQSLPNCPPMLVTYNAKARPSAKLLVGSVENRCNHPCLSNVNQLVMLLLRMVQGEGGVYFAGSYVTPANGHDLSLLCGLVIAHFMGAEYPFAAHAECVDDYNRLAGLMGFPRFAKA